jgi:hypothetical protein
MDFTDTQQDILADAWLLAREGKGQVLEDWAEPDAQELSDAGWLERRTVDANGDTAWFWTSQAEAALDMNALRNRPGGHELMRRRVLRSMGTGRPSRVFPGGGSPLPSMGDRCRSGGSGHARCRAGCHSPRRPAHLPDDGPVMPSEMSKQGARPCPEGTCGGNTRPAAGRERTLMGPVTQGQQRRARAPKAPDPLRAHLLKRSTGREVWDWPNHRADELMRRGEGTPPRSVTSPRRPRSYPAMLRICRAASGCTSSRSQLIRGCGRSLGGPRL